MAVINVPGRVSGRSYPVQIFGASPTPEEQQEIAQYVAEQEAAYSTEYNRLLGPVPERDDGTAFGRGLDVGLPSVKSAIGQAVQSGGQALSDSTDLGFLKATGNYISDYGQSVEDANNLAGFTARMEQPTPKTYQEAAADPFDAGLTYLGELAGSQAPQLGASLTAGAVGAVVGGTTMGPGGALMGFNVGSSLISAPIMFGYNVQRQEEEFAAGRLAKVDLVNALQAAVGQTALEVVADRFLIGRLINPSQIRNIFVRVGTGATTGAATESLTEVGQQMLERAQAGLPIDSDEAFEEYKQAAIAGGILGGGFKSVASIRRANPKDPFAGTEQDDTFAGDVASQDFNVDNTDSTVSPTVEAAPVDPTIEQPTTPVEFVPAEQTVAPEVATEVAPTTINEDTDFIPAANYSRIQEVLARFTERLDPARMHRQETLLSETRDELINLGVKNPDAFMVPIQTRVAPTVVAPKVAPFTVADIDPTIIDDDFLDSLGIKKQAPIRKKVKGKDLNDPEVIKLLEKHAKVTADKTAAKNVTAKLKEISDAAVTTADKSSATGIESGVEGQRVEPTGTASTTEFEASEEGRLGDIVSGASNDNVSKVTQQNTLGLFENMGQDGALMEYPEIADSLDKYVQNIDFAALDAAIKSEEYAQYKATMDANLAQAFPSGEISVTRTEGYADPKKKKTKRKLKVSPKDVAFIGNEDERELVIRTPDGKLQSVSIDGTLEEVPLDQVVKGIVQSTPSTTQSNADLAAQALVQKTEAASVARKAAIKKLTEAPVALPVGPVKLTGAPTEQQIINAERKLAENSAEAMRAAEPEKNSKAAVALATRYALKADPQVKAYHKEMGGDAYGIMTNPDRTTSEDKGKVLDLLNRPNSKLTVEEKAAANFFSKFARPVDALKEMVSHEYFSPSVISTKGEQNAQAEKFYAGLGAKAAIAAKKWVGANMSPETQTYVGELSKRAEAERDAFISRGQTDPVKRDRKNKEAEAVVTDSVDTVIAQQETAVLADRNRLLEEPEVRVRSTAVTRAAARRSRADKKEKLEDKALADAGFTPAEIGRLRDEIAEMPDPITNTEAAALTIPEKAQRVQARGKSQRAKVTFDLIMNNYAEDAKLSPQQKKLLLELPQESVYGLDMPLISSIQNLIENGNLRGALEAISATSVDPQLRGIAAALARVAGTTKVVISDAPLLGANDSILAGMFDPKTNTVTLSRESGMNTHTIMHEMTHAAVSATLANKGAALTKQMTALFETVKANLEGVYGTTSLDEFVSEAFSNPNFQAALALIKADPNQRKFSVLERFRNIVGNIIRILRRQPIRPIYSALDESTQLINSMLAPAPEFRDAGEFYLEAAGGQQSNQALLNSTMDYIPFADQSTVEQTKTLLNENTPVGLKKLVLGLMPINVLSQVARTKIPMAPVLNRILDRQKGEYDSSLKKLDPVLQEMTAWAKKDKKGIQALDYLIPNTTYAQVDPSLPVSFYSKYWLTYNNLDADGNKLNTENRDFDTAEARDAEIARLNATPTTVRSKVRKAGNASQEKVKVWRELQSKWREAGPQGQEYYKTLRDFFANQREELPNILRATLEANIPDVAARQAAFDKLAELLMKESGVIRPFFPLTRKGAYRLMYNAYDPKTGTFESYTEYFDSPTLVRKAADAVLAYNANNAAMQARVDREVARKQSAGEPAVSRANIIKAMTAPKPSMTSTRQDYSGAPSSSFVHNVLTTLQGRADQQVIDDIIELALDNLPERSFMQSFRGRGDSKNPLGIRGFLGDITPTGDIAQKFSTIEMVDDKGKGLIRQITQMKYGAILQKYRNDMNEYVKTSGSDQTTVLMAEKLDQIASFAQRPNVNKYAKMATSAGFMYTMGANISSTVANFFDLPISTYSMLAGRYGDAASVAAMGKASRLFLGSPRTRNVNTYGADGDKMRKVSMGSSIGNIDFSDPNLPSDKADMKELVDAAFKLGALDTSLTREMLDITDGKEVLQKANKLMSFFFHHGERFNREVSMGAAYILELDRLRKADPNTPLTTEQKTLAAEKAIEMTEFSQGGTAAAGTAVLAQNGIGKVMYLFKRFAIQKYYMLARLSNDAFNGADAETRGIARAQLARVFVMSGLLGGASGMPMMGAIGMIYDMFSSDDEDDFEAMSRKIMPNLVYGGLANYMLGSDFSGRISMNSLLYRRPLIDKDQSNLWTLMETMGGPVVGMGLSVERGVGQINEGDVWSGVKSMSPAFIKNAMKGFDLFNDKAALTKRRDVITDEISPYNTLMQFAGFAPESRGLALAENKNERRIDAALKSKRGKLLRKMNMAIRENDTQGLIDANTEIMEFNARMMAIGRPERRITSTTKKRSRAGFVRTSGNMVNGIVMSPDMVRNTNEFDGEE
jgi:hypothetical protein